MTTSSFDAGAARPARLTDRAALRREVEEVIDRSPVVDLHTHLYAPEFGELGLSGIDELLTYHYLIAETFRSAAVTYERFWRMSKTEQADLVWQTLFVENTPVSEATRGVVTALTAFGLDPAAPDLEEARAFFREQDPAAHLDRVLELSRVSDVVMTNDPFDARETRVWTSGTRPDARFHAALRMDRLLNDWEKSSAELAAQGYEVDAGFGGATAAEVRRFLDRWIERMGPLYMAVSLPDSFQYPATVDGAARDRVIREVVLPTAREHGLPFAVMIGVRRGVNPALRMAGDGLGRADASAVERLCEENPDVRFLATFLSRENQHELCVSSRKFPNLMPFGCWWFLNNPSIIAEVTAERLELLGTSFIAQHSDARVLEQLVYKWKHSRRVIADVLAAAYERLLESGRAVTRAEIERDAARLFSGNFRAWLAPGGAGEGREPQPEEVGAAEGF
jgi:hypothetical protein